MRPATLALVLSWPITAQAAEGTGSGGAVETTTIDPSTLPTQGAAARPELVVDRPRVRAPRRERWIRRWAPERNTVELGAYAGGVEGGPGYELFRPDRALPDQGHRPLAPVLAEMGGRLGYYPSRFLGLEVEGGAAPAETAELQRMTMWNARGSMVLQLGLWNLAPFVLAGAGAVGVRSDRSVVGNDVDPALHVGGGLKLELNRNAQLRVDVRDVLVNGRGSLSVFSEHHLQALLGVSIVLGRSRSAAADGDGDGDGDEDHDGVLDAKDRCPAQAGGAPLGCPVVDSDYDGVADAQDRCMDEAGLGSDGCPVHDFDRDGFPDEVDRCARETGVSPHGCPVVDTDGDGWIDFIDECPSMSETVNDFEDRDGCPDMLPSDLEVLDGVMEGIHFQSGKARILARSLPRLDRVAALMRGFPEVHVEISGHTDASGPRELNLDLSKQRADAVRTYLVAQGVAAERMVTRGAGPDEPIADNLTQAGRLENRRIEFAVRMAQEDPQ